MRVAGKVNGSQSDETAWQIERISYTTASTSNKAAPSLRSDAELTGLERGKVEIHAIKADDSCSSFAGSAITHFQERVLHSEDCGAGMAGGGE